MWLLPAYPLLVFLAGALLAWRFRRWRMLVATLSLAAAERALAVTLASATPAAPIMTATAAAALPLNLTALAWLPERGRPVVGWSVGLVAVEALAAGLLAQPEAAPIAGLLVHPFAGDRLPAIGLLAFSTALALAALRLTLRPQALECGMFWALLAALLAFGADAPASASIALAGAGLVLLVSLVETSHAIAYGDELTGLPSRRALLDTGVQSHHPRGRCGIEKPALLPDAAGIGHTSVGVHRIVRVMYVISSQRVCRLSGAARFREVAILYFPYRLTAIGERAIRPSHVAAGRKRDLAHFSRATRKLERVAQLCRVADGLEQSRGGVRDRRRKRRRQALIG